MTTSFATNHTATRKAHVCDWCGTRIAIGEQYSRWRYYDCGDASTVRAHVECERAMFAAYSPGEEMWLDRDRTRGCTCEIGDHGDWCPEIKAVQR